MGQGKSVPDRRISIIEAVSLNPWRRNLFLGYRLAFPDGLKRAGEPKLKECHPVEVLVLQNAPHEPVQLIFIDAFQRDLSHQMDSSFFVTSEPQILTKVALQEPKVCIGATFEFWCPDEIRLNLHGVISQLQDHGDTFLVISIHADIPGILPVWFPVQGLLRQITLNRFSR